MGSVSPDAISACGIADGARRDAARFDAAGPGRVGEAIAAALALTAAEAAVKMAARLGVRCTDPVILADGANVIVYLSPAPVVAKVAASTPAVRPEPAAWLQRELDVTRFLAGRDAPVVAPSPEVPATVSHGDGQVMSFWQYVDSSGDALPREATIGSMLRIWPRRRPASGWMDVASWPPTVSR